MAIGNPASKGGVSLFCNLGIEGKNVISNAKLLNETNHAWTLKTYLVTIRRLYKTIKSLTWIAIIMDFA